ncbi:MAG: serine--tRNA ligase [Microgenomates group bacterium]|nr:serine--tRNA ligase [Microgenomates group bacterium]
MLSIDYLRQNKEKVIKAAKNKRRPIELEKIFSLDDQRKKLIFKIQKLREERNKLSKIKPSEEQIKQVQTIKQELKSLENQLKDIEKELNFLLLQIPNVPLDQVPSDNNKEIKHWGKIPHFNFPFQSHIQLGKALDIIDLDRGSKISGYRGYFLKKQGAQLHLAVLTYAFNKLIKKGYIPLIAPAIVKEFTLVGSGQFPWGKTDVYKIDEDDSYLAGTAEVPVTAYFANEILAEKDLPLKFVALSPCFRKEAGAYGKDTRGLYRLHEFWKVEQVVIANNNLEEALKIHQELQKNSEEIIEELGLPYRVMLMSIADLGEPQVIKYDLEAWMPSRNNYGEIGSNSLMADFQTRRLNIKFRKKNGQKEYCFSLNNTALASPRILIPLLEINQQKDGSVLIPEVLTDYLGFKKISLT